MHSMENVMTQVYNRCVRVCFCLFQLCSIQRCQELQFLFYLLEKQIETFFEPSVQDNKIV